MKMTQLFSLGFLGGLLGLVSAALSFTAGATSCEAGELVRPLATPTKATSSPTLSYELFAKLYDRLNAGETAGALGDTIPDFEAKLAIAREISAKYWTNSTIFDELAHQDILPDNVLDNLGIPLDVTSGIKHVPAGMMHTYGYLFSQLKTAFGLKGKRWIESRIDERLGLPAGTFSPLTTHGEFLSNLTGVLTELSDHPDPRTLGRLDEVISWQLPDGQTKTGIVTTQLVKLAPLVDLDTTDVALLIYSLTLDGERRFVTAFPVGQSFVDGIAATKAQVGYPFKPRYNLYVDPSWVVTSYQTRGYLP